MKKIAVICTLYGPHGGTGRVTTEVIERYAYEGNEVHVFCADYDHDFASKSAVKTITQIPVTNIKVMKQLDLLCKATRMVKPKEYDIIYSTGDYHLHPDIVTIHTLKGQARRTIKKYEKKKIIPKTNSRLKSFLRCIYCPLLFEIGEKIVYRNEQTKYICVSKGVKRDFCALFHVNIENVTVIANAVDKNEYSPNENKRNKLRSELEIGSNDKVMLFVGSDWQRKRLDVAINVVKRHKELILLVAGHDAPGKYISLAEELNCADRVKFIGFKQNIADYYAISDYFIFPSVYETFGLVALEAMASGVIVISNRLNGVEDFIEDGRNGFITENVSIDAFSKVMQYLLDHPELEDEIRREAVFTANNMNWDNCYQQYKQVFDSFQRKAL